MTDPCLTIALVAHDRTKKSLIHWFLEHVEQLSAHTIVATGTTGRLLRRQMVDHAITINAVQSGPFGGDQQIGAMIANQNIDALIFFEDVLTPQPHDVDVKALLRLAVLYEVPVACNRASADIMVSSPLFFDKSKRKRYPDARQDFARYLNRSIDFE